MREAYREILATIPVVITGIRNASKRIEETISDRFPGTPTARQGTVPPTA